MTNDSDKASHTDRDDSASVEAGPASELDQARTREQAEPVRPAGRRTDAGSKASASPPPRGGRLLGTLALLLAFASLGGVGYLYYELIYRGTSQSLEQRLIAVDTRTAGMQDELAQMAARQQAALEAFRQREEAARLATEAGLRESLSQVARQAPPSTGEWQRAEVQYLLRIANHRLLMERDASGALRLLRAADVILGQLDDFSLHEVRARLADEIAALENVPGIDLQGLFLRLEALKRNLDELPLRLPEYLAREPEPPPSDKRFWNVLAEELDGYLRMRRFDGAVKPLLAPEEAVYLEFNLRLMLERAQLAGMRRETLIYQESLATAAAWIREFLDLGERPVQRMLEELTALQRVNLEQPLPDISGSLNALQDVLRTPA